MTNQQRVAFGLGERKRYEGTGHGGTLESRIAGFRNYRTGHCVCGQLVADHFDASNRKLSCSDLKRCAVCRAASVTTLCAGCTVMIGMEG